MKVLWLTNIPSPYRVDFFNELGKQCELTVLFERQASEERDDSWKQFSTDHFHAVFLPGKTIGVAEAFCPSVIRYLTKAYDRIVVTNFSDPTGMLAIQWLKIRRIPYCLESDGAFPGSGTGMKEHVKRWIIAGAAQYFSTASIHDDYYRLYGAPADRIVRYPFTSVHAKDVLSEPVGAEQKAALRAALEMTEQHIVVSVGQFIHRKGYDILMKACTVMDSCIGVYIIGGRPTEEYLNMVRDYNLSNVHFVGFKKKDELERYYMSADVFVLPTREDIWGLVVNEAMAKGLPVVTTDRCVAGLEMVKNGSNGMIVPVEDAQGIAQAVTEVIKRPDMAQHVLETARQYTIEHMTGVHIQAWQM